MLNLTQHSSTPEQLCTDLVGENLETLKGLLTFEDLPDWDLIVARAQAIARLAKLTSDGQHDSAMIGGAPFLMGPLSEALWDVGIKPMFAFSVRESVDQPQADGSVRKVAVFRHAGFIG